MSSAQATKFADTYAVVNQYTDSSTGLSATVFMNNQTGALNLAIRGTEGFFDVDMLADAQLLLGGAARAQIVSLYNYVQRLTTPAGQMALQVEDVAPNIDPITGYINDPGGIRATASVTSLGYLSGVSGVTVTGHSLGGHLAAAASRLFPGLISSTDTYNAPGFSLNYADAFLDQFPGDAGAFSGTITNLVANAGTDIIAAVGTLPGTPERIFIEDQGVGIPGNHGIIPLTDSLAVYDLFATIAPAASVSAITDILKASAGVDTKSLENTLDTLRTLFQQNYVNSTANGNAAPTFVNDRNDFYTKLYSLQTYLKNTPFYNATTQSFSFTVDKLTNAGAATLTTNAQTDIAYRYALYKLNPFVVNNAPALYSTINTDHSLDRYDSSTRTGALTDEYLKDRAAFLYNKIDAGTNDRIYSETLNTPYVPGVSLQVFEDRASNYQLYTGDPYAVGITPLSQFNQIRFGSVNIDTLTGGDTWDKLYGMDGNDTLQGKKGNDYLEGGQGTDTYIYTSGDGTDTILDTDHLGQIQYDGIFLNGGKLTQTGDNTYKSDDGRFIYTLLHGIGASDWLNISGPGGNIIIKDFASGNLNISLNAAGPLPPDTSPGPSSFWGAAPPNVPVSSTVTVSTTTVTGPSGTTVTTNPSPLPATQTATELRFRVDPVSDTTTVDTQGTPETSDDITTHIVTENWIYRGPQTVMTDDDTDHNISADAVTTTINGAGGNDTLDGRGVNNIALYGGDGNDTLRNGYLLHGNNGDDWLDGYGGPDQLYGDAGNDILYFYPLDPVGDALADGGSGKDAIIGWSDGNNHFIGGSNTDTTDEGDLIISQGGNDHLEGGYGNDALFDYLGADILEGGPGDDYLYGNASVGSYNNPTTWTITPVLDTINGVQFTNNQYLFPAPQYTGFANTNFAPTSDNKGDVLLGGAGNDYLNAGPGDDLLDAGTTDDTAADTNVLFAGLGNDVLMGGAGRDWLFGDGEEDNLLKQAA